MRDNGSLVVQVDAGEISPGEFAHLVRAAVEKENIQTVVIDSLNGYQNAMSDERHLMLHLHELSLYLNRVGAGTVVTVAQHGMVGEMKGSVDISYLADTVILLRYFEAFGEVRRAISVLKKRAGSHERTIREYAITSEGLTLGPVLQEFQGVLRGVPEYVGSRGPMAKKDDE
jgi:circadian clock protein KaiC